MRYARRFALTIILFVSCPFIAQAQLSIGGVLNACEFNSCADPTLRVNEPIGVSALALQTINLGRSVNGLFPNHYLLTFSGDIGNLIDGNGTQCQASSPTQGQNLGGIDTVYSDVGIHLVTATLFRCLITFDSNGIEVDVPDEQVLTVVGSITVFPPSTPPPAGCTTAPPVLIDPVQSLLVRGSSIATFPEMFTIPGITTVQGVAADGVTKVVLKIPASDPNDNFTVTVFNGQAPSTSTHDDGGLFLLGREADNPASSLSVSPVDTSQGSMVFAIYRAPANFSRGTADDTLGRRQITLRVTCQSNSASQSDKSVLIVRPPVVLVHGMWDSPRTWDNFIPLINDPTARFDLTRVDYSSPILGITSSVPSYSAKQLSNAQQNIMGFDYNAPIVLDDIRKAIRRLRRKKGIAAVQVDIVAHSLGGNIVRAIALRPDFLSNENYRLGFIHKLITIGTPHLGSPLAIQMLQSANKCVRDHFADKGRISLQTATILGQTVSGAIGDLQGDGNGGSMSPALQSLPLSQSFVTAYIDGIATQANFNGLDCINCTSTALKKWCSGPLASNLTSAGWPAVFSFAPSDAIVPTQSQKNNSTVTGVVHAAVDISGVIHSTGIEVLDFTGPAELDQASNAANIVINLLNEQPNGADFNDN